jgi:DNA gyrase subunit A
MIVTITHSGYIKRTNSDEYRLQARGGKGIKAATTKNKKDAADYVEHLFAAQNHDYIMFFTNTGRVYVERVYEIDEAARSAQGRSIKNLLDMQADERIAAILRLERRVSEDGKDITFAEDSGNVVFATKDGTVKKTALNDFVNYRKAGIIAINLEEGNTLVNAALTSGEDEVVLVTHDGMSIRFAESDMRAQGRNTIGVRGIKLREGDYVVGAARANPDKDVLTITERGYGKRTELSEYLRTAADGTKTAQQRGGKGLKNYNITDKTGLVAGCRVVAEDDDVMLIENGGVIIRVPAASINVYKRDVQGVIVMRIEEGNQVVSVERIDNIAEEEA